MSVRSGHSKAIPEILSLRKALPQKSVKCIWHVPVIILVAGFCKIKIGVASGVMVVGTNPSPLDQRPETLNGVRVDITFGL